MQDDFRSAVFSINQTANILGLLNSEVHGRVKRSYMTLILGPYYAILLPVASISVLLIVHLTDRGADIIPEHF